MAETAAAFRTVIDRAPRITVIGTIVIRDFVNEMKVTKVGDSLESEVFTLKGEPFVVEVYAEHVLASPRGSREGSESESESESEFAQYVKMRLSNRGNKEVFVESIKMEVCDVPGEKKARVGVMPCKQAQTAAFYSKTMTDLQIYLKDGVFEAKIEVELLGDRIVTSSATPAQLSGSSNNNLWVLEQLFRDLPDWSDFSLVSEEGEEVPCHKIVLTGASSYFRGKWKEFKGSNSKVECSTEVARNLVRFFYTGQIEDSCLNGQEETFLRLADFYQVEELKLYVEARMLQVLGRPNMVDFFKLGDTYKANRIREAAKKLLRSSMTWLRERGDWKVAFGEKNMGLLNEVLIDLV